MKKFAAKNARPLPVIILADTSGSMSVDGKIDALNQALRDLVGSFSKESRLNAEIQLSIITFGGDQAKEYLPLTPAHKISSFPELQITGKMTPMGGAFKIAKELIEDKERVPLRAYRPFIVLVSDGYPNDENWEDSFTALCNSERAKKATRMAMAIGSEADLVMLKNFTNDPEAPVFKGNAKDVIRFFRVVSMSVSSRSRNITLNQPNKIEYDDIPEDEDLDLNFS